MLAVAAGATFGLTAALMKGMTRTFSEGITVLFTSWELYGMIAAGVLGMFLVQSAMNAGRLIAAQPGLTLSDPIVSILWGVFAFGERVRGGWYIALAVVSGLAMAAAVVMLAHSPLPSRKSGQQAEKRQARGRDRRLPVGRRSWSRPGPGPGYRIWFTHRPLPHRGGRHAQLNSAQTRYITS